MSSYSPPEIELAVLAHGLDFNIPFTSISRENIFSEFEVYYAQLSKLQPVSGDKPSDFRTKLNDLAHSYASSPISFSESNWRSKHHRVIKSLKNNHSLVITKPDKGSGVGLMDRHDYISKMLSIFNDRSKFQRLGSIDTHDSTLTSEIRFQKRLVKWVKSGVLPSEMAGQLRPCGSIRPRLYGLPKIHKDGVPLRPILSMIGSSQHKVAKWLAIMLQPVLQRYSTFCIKDSFTFSQFIRNCDATDGFMCSFDICSLFTCVPLSEIIDICSDMLYRSNLTPPTIPENVFVELMKFATMSVDFSFDNIMYRQIDGVAMGSPLGPVLANIFVVFYE